MGQCFMLIAKGMGGVKRPIIDCNDILLMGLGFWMITFKSFNGQPFAS